MYISYIFRIFAPKYATRIYFMEKTESRNFCVILAGGRGRRLWPASRNAYPKQFMDFFGTGKTMLQTTVDRFCKILPKENIYVGVCTKKAYIALLDELSAPALIFI